MVAATRLGALLDRLDGAGAALPTTDLEQLQREASVLSTQAAGAIELVKSGLIVQHAAAEGVPRAAAFQMVSAGVLGLDAGPLLACLLLRVGLLEEGGSMAKLLSLLMAEFAEVGHRVGQQPPSDAAGGIRAACSAMVREPLLVSLMDRSRHYMELAQERDSSSALLVQAAAGGLADGLGYLLQALPGGPGAGWTAFQQMLDVEILSQSFIPRLSAAVRAVRVGDALPLSVSYWLPLLHVAAAATRHAAGSGLAGAEQPVEDALDVVTFLLVGDVVLEQPAVQHGLQLAIRTVGSAAAALGRAAGEAHGCGAGSSASPGLGGVLRSFRVAVGHLATSVGTCSKSSMASVMARREGARQRAWDTAWMGQDIVELSAAVEAFQRLAFALSALADGRMLAGGLDAAEAGGLAQDLAVHSHTLVT